LRDKDFKAQQKSDPGAISRNFNAIKKQDRLLSVDSSDKF